MDAESARENDIIEAKNQSLFELEMLNKPLGYGYFGGGNMDNVSIVWNSRISS